MPIFVSFARYIFRIFIPMDDKLTQCCCAFTLALARLSCTVHCVNPCIIVIRYQNKLWNVQRFNVKMLTEDMLQSLLQQMFKMASHSTDTSPGTSSPLVSRLIDNCLLYARPDRTQTLLLAIGLSKVSKVIQSGLIYRFVAISFTDLLATNLQTHTHCLKMWFSLHRPMRRLM